MKGLHIWNSRAVKLGVTLFCLSGLVLTGCGKKKDDVDTIRKSGELKAAVVDYQNEYMKNSNGSFQGIEAELVGNIADALGVTQSFEISQDAADALAKVKAGEADLAIAMITDQTYLEKELEASVSYGEEKLYVVTRREDYSDSPAAFSERTLGTDRSLMEIVSGLSNTVENLNTMGFQNTEEAMKALTESQRIDGYVCRYQEGIKLLDQASREGIISGKLSIQMQNLQNVEPEEFVIVTRAGGGRLMEGINTIIRNYLDAKSDTKTAQ